MDNGQKNSVPRKQGWRNYQFDIIVLTTTGALIAYLVNRLTTDQPVPSDYLPEEFLDSRDEPFYYDTPVDCPPCDKGIKYEWFYVEPPLDIDGAEEEEIPTSKQEGGEAMDP